MTIFFLTLKIKRQEALVATVLTVIDGLNMVLEISKTITGANGQFRDHFSRSYFDKSSRANKLGS